MNRTGQHYARGARGTKPPAADRTAGPRPLRHVSSSRRYSRRAAPELTPTGRPGYTAPGNLTPFRMEVDHESKELDDTRTPHSIFFTTKGHAIHGMLESRRLGVAASHGCVRLAPDNAAKLVALVKEEGLPNTEVEVAGNEDLIARRAPLRAPVAEPVADDTGDAYAQTPIQGTAPNAHGAPAPLYADFHEALQLLVRRLAG